MFEIGYAIQVQAIVGTKRNGWSGNTYVPTFVLPSLLGIANWDQAGALALEILFPASIPREVAEVKVTLMVMNDEVPVATCTYVRKFDGFIQV